MPLGFSVGEWIVTVGVVVVAFGPKDIPVIARGLGKLTGQAVGKDGTTTHAQQKRRRKRTHLVFILGMPTSDSPHTTHVISPLSNSLSLSLSLSLYRLLSRTLTPGFVGIMTAKVDKLAKNSQVSELHQEMKQSMSELVGVTEEIRAGFNPLAVGRRILQEESGGSGGGGGRGGNPQASPGSSSPGQLEPPPGLGWRGAGGGSAAVGGVAAASSSSSPPPRVQVTPVAVPGGGGGGGGAGFAAGGVGWTGAGGSGGTHHSPAAMGAAAAAAAAAASRSTSTPPAASHYPSPSSTGDVFSGGGGSGSNVKTSHSQNVAAASSSSSSSPPAAASHLPFSAVSLGRARLRPEITGGADIILDGIVEAEVAARAVALMESGELDHRVAQQQDKARARGDTVV